MYGARFYTPALTSALHFSPKKQCTLQLAYTEETSIAEVQC